MLSVFVLNSKSSVILSLLQTSSDAINTFISQLMDSACHLSTADISYYTSYDNKGYRKFFIYL